MKLILASTAITTVVGLGLLIDAESRPVHDVAESDPTTYRIYAPGRIEGTTPDVELRCQLVGRIVEVLVHEGDLVEQGQLLLRLDDEQYQHEVALAQAELDAAEAQKDRLLNGARTEERSEAEALYRASRSELQQAENKWERIRKLSAAHAIAQQEADDHKSLIDTLRARTDAAKARADLVAAAARPDELALAESRIAMAKAQHMIAKDQFQKTRIVAPSIGRVLKINVEQGELAGPTAVEPPLVLVDTRQFQVRAFVEELDAPRLKVGMPALVTADGMPGKVLRGRIARLSPRMTRKDLFSDRPSERLDTKVREVWIELSGADELVIGLPVDVMIEPAK